MKKRYACASVVACLAMFAIASYGAGSNAVRIKMTINDDATLNLHSDGLGQVAPNLYIDSGLPNGDVCASGSVNSTGFSVFYPGRKEASGLFCNASIPAADRRTYEFRFPFADGNSSDGFPGPCQYLGVPEDLDPLGHGTGFCTVRTDDLDFERITLSGLFAKKGTTTAAQFSLVYRSVQLGVVTDQPASIVLDSNPNLRTAAYTGTARLYLVVNGSASQQVTSPFALPFQIRVERAP